MVIDRRIVAFLIDLSIIVILTLLAFGAVAQFDFTELGDLAAAESFCEEREGDGLCLPSQTGSMVVVFTRIASPLVFHTCLWLLRGVMEGALGWTPGKRIAKIRVVDAGGESIGVARGLIRAVLLVFDGFPWGAPMLVGLLIASNSRRQQRLGDLATDSYVVHEAAVGSFISQPVVVTTPLPDPRPSTPTSVDSGPASPTAPVSAPGAVALPSGPPVSSTGNDSLLGANAEAPGTPSGLPSAGGSALGSIQPGPVVMPTSPPIAGETPPPPSAPAPRHVPPQTPGMHFDEVQQRWTWVEGDRMLVWDDATGIWRQTDS